MISSGATGRKKLREPAGKPTKKLKINLSKSKPKVPDSFEAEMWTKLKESTTAIFSQSPVSHSREELYRAVEDLCIHKLSANLFTNLKQEIDRHIGAKVLSLVGQTLDLGAYLALVTQMWQDYCDQMLTIRSIFLYLDRTYILQVTDARSFWDMGLATLRYHLDLHPEVKSKLVDGLLQQIELERCGETVNQSVIRGLVRMLTAVRLYNQDSGNDLETRFLDATREFYRAESAQKLDTLTVPEYLAHSQSRLQQESERLQAYLDSSTRKQLISSVEREILGEHVPVLLEKGFKPLLEQNRSAELARFYSLLARVNALPQMQTAFAVHVRSVGSRIVKDEPNDKEMISELLTLKAKLDAVIDDAMRANPDFQRTLREGFEFFINARPVKPAELMAKYVDQQLRSGNKGGSEAEIELLLDRVMVLFRFINGKDVFEAFYKKDLAKRLLLGKSASYELERSMISKLKSECGASFTSKLEGMFRDIDMSRDLMTKFEATRAATAGSSNSAAFTKTRFDMDVHVLATGFWPPTPQVEVTLPPMLAAGQKEFSDFYLAKYTGRRLAWQHSLGHCLLRFNLPNIRKELAVSLFQATVLLLFNEQPTLDYKRIREATGLEDGELKRTLQSLACGKVRVLTKTPKGREVTESDEFAVCTDFRHKAFRIKINSIQLKETAKDVEDTHAHVQAARQYQIDAAIVRVMKARKRLTHTLLLADLFKQLQFPTKPADLKKRIESLIDREYLERDEEEANTYIYLA